jgi:hypothetical protein
MSDSVEIPSTWRLRYDILSVRVMLLLAGGIGQLAIALTEWAHGWGHLSQE